MPLFQCFRLRKMILLVSSYKTMIYGRTYIKDLFDTKSSSAAKVFGNTKRSRRKLRGAFITHIDGTPVFSTAQAQAKFASLYKD